MLGFTALSVLFQYAISPLIVRWIYRIDWIPYDAFVSEFPHLADTLNKVVSIQGIKTPKMGIIHDGNPNAFTFGWSKNSARVVLTDGILHHLNKKEQNAVLAHELGHVVHSDFILMTIVFAIPLVLLTIARWAYYTALLSGRRSSSRDSEEASLIYLLVIAIAVLSYVAYYIGFLISLVISRIREYYADQHAAEVTEDPNALSTGLVKIAYGLVADQGLKEVKARNRSKVRALRGLGIFDPNSAKYFAASSVGVKGVYSHEAVEAAAAWDLYNPWAKYYQLYSTHPLPAKRIQRLNDQCVLYGKKPEFDLSNAKRIKEEQAGKSMLPEFITDLIIKSLPTLIFIALIALSIVWIFDIVGFYDLFFISTWSIKDMVLFWAIGFYIIAFGFIAKTQFRYRSGFTPTNVLNLVTNVNVSPIRCVPAIVEGRIIGRGIPGYYFSEDLYFQDETGLMYIDYRFGLRIVDFFWAIARADRLTGQRVRITGWYRRGPSPYLQVDTIETEFGKRYRNYSKHMTYIWAVISFLIGLLILYFWFQI